MFNTNMNYKTQKVRRGQKELLCYKSTVYGIDEPEECICSDQENSEFCSDKCYHFQYPEITGSCGNIFIPMTRKYNTSRRMREK